jgi:hypothetical protein
MDAFHPLPFFVMQQVFLEIANNWDERPLELEQLWGKAIPLYKTQQLAQPKKKE